VPPCRRAACAILTIVDRLLVATLNILNLADRWPERQGLIYAEMAALQPDLIALQEVVYVMQQDRLIGASGDGRYAAVRGWAGRPEYGNSLLVREPLRAESEVRLDLGLQRAAHRVRIALPGGATVLVAVTHFHHPPAAHAERNAQAEALLAWLDDGRASPTSADATILAGDFNAGPDEPAYARIAADGFRSAHLETNGSEPSVTWPSGLVAPAMDTDGPPNCLDYIWIRGAVRAIDCRLVFDRPAAEDPTLYPSDHFGLATHLEIG
jgi:endonuclease/exonuclease/phosphatase family metal-dependent hydrolase